MLVLRLVLSEFGTLFSRSVHIEFNFIIQATYNNNTMGLFPIYSPPESIEV
jgi:hypothetical protein